MTNVLRWPAGFRADGEARLRVLLVEDNDSDAMIAQAAVEKAMGASAEVVRAASLSTALAIVRSADVHLVLLDLNLPDSRHFATLERIQAVARCPIIVVTVEDSPTVDAEVLQRGAFEILHKGRIGQDEITRLLRLAEGHRKLRASYVKAEERNRLLGEQLEELSQLDPLTGLPNRSLLQERTDQAIAQARRRSRGAGVLLVALDGFKLVNDTLGHQAGDDLLVQVGKRIRHCVRPDDTVAHVGGDEFAVAVADLARADDAAVVAKKIVEVLCATFNLGLQKVDLTASVGAATYPNDGDSASGLLRAAHTAMSRVKDTTRNGFCFYSADMDARARARLRLHSDLRLAVERSEFRLHYQPKVLLASGEIFGVEALLRWEHPERGMVSPADFIPALENTGLIDPVGTWVIAEACAQLGRWSAAGIVPVPIAVNLSAKQFQRRDLPEVILSLLEAYSISPGLLELEITESCLMEDPLDAVRQLQKLRDAGLQISVDDFGTGYSSLAYLTRLPVWTLKIDRSFVHAAISDTSSAAIVHAVIDLARNLKFNIIAEGIESEEHADFLRRSGCDHGQGYLYGKPVSALGFTPRLARHRS